jgi:hypothetical protein
MTRIAHADDADHADHDPDPIEIARTRSTQRDSIRAIGFRSASSA